MIVNHEIIMVDNRAKEYDNRKGEQTDNAYRL